MKLATASYRHRLRLTSLADPAKWQLRTLEAQNRGPYPLDTVGRTPDPWMAASFPSQTHCRGGSGLLLQGNCGRRRNRDETVAGTVYANLLHRRNVQNGDPVATSGSPAISESRCDPSMVQQNSEGSVDRPRAMQDLLDALDSVKKSADRGASYLLESRLAKALPHRSDAASLAADISRLVSELELLKQERAALTAFRHQTPKEIRGEYFQMMLTGLFTGLAAAIHPILFIGSVYGLIRIRRARRAETDRDAGTNRLEEISRIMKEKKGDLNALLSKLSRMVKES